MPEEAYLETQPPEQPVRHRPHRPRRRNAVSRRISSLRRSQRKLAGEETLAASTAAAQTAAPADSAEPRAEPAEKTRGRLRAAILHPGRGQILAAVILFVVGAAGVMQIKSNAAGDTYASARREDLIQLLDGLSEESRRLEGEIAQLEQTRSNLQSGADTQRVAREEAQKHFDELSILAGTAPAQGPGIRMRIADPKDAVDAGAIASTELEPNSEGYPADLETLVEGVPAANDGTVTA